MQQAASEQILAEMLNGAVAYRLLPILHRMQPMMAPMTPLKAKRVPLYGMLRQYWV